MQACKPPPCHRSTTRMVGLTAAEVSFAKTSELLAVLAGVEVETRQVERCAEALGRDVADDERALTEQTAPAPAPAPTLYLGMDGTGVPVRPAEVERRRGKQPDGSAKTREVKLATVWTAEGRDPQGRPVRDPGSVSYNAAVESTASRDTDPQPAAFAQRLHTRGATARLRHRGPPGRHRRRRRLDLERRRRAVSRRHRNRRHLPRQAASVQRGQGHLRPPERTWPTSGPGTGVPSWTPAGSAPSSQRCASMSRPRPRREGAFTMCSGTDTACALSAVPRQGPVHLFGRRRGRMQADRRTAQARRHALDRRRRQRHHRPALLPAQRPLRGLLGATSRKRRLRGVSQ